MEIYTLQQPKMPWGDYGRILLAGMTARLLRQAGQLQLERTGPFLPPLAVAGGGDIVVTDAFKAALERSGLTGCAFRPVVKRHIVYLPWERWDRAAAEPPVYPEGGEPENYILRRPHALDLAAQMGAVWEVVLGEHARSCEEPALPGEVPSALRALYPEASAASLAHLILFFPDRAIVRETWDGSDWFRVADARHTYISGRAALAGACGARVDRHAARCGALSVVRQTRPSQHRLSGRPSPCQRAAGRSPASRVRMTRVRRRGAAGRDW